MREKMSMISCPDVSIYHDEKDKNLIAEIGLPGVWKKDIALEAGEEGFCVKAERRNIRYDSCFCFDERVIPERVHAEFENGLLTLRAPINERLMRARRISVT